MRRIAIPTVVALLAIVSSAAIASSPPVFGGDIAGFYRQRPAHIHITSDQNIAQIHWSSWGGTTARATGTMEFSVADGLPPAPVRLKLTRIQQCGHRRQYLRLVINYVGSPATGQSSTSTIGYTCRSPY